ncbi:MAG TPA: MobF family relaxase [Acidimicrobiales bacterium]|jgi:conjugative relaxase-like TrwC/TraI family protein|nr:MobF family relaxase [Acidimicrobiales bacterium]
MLGIRRIGAGRADYYLADLAAELPVATGAGRWVGAAAHDLGLDCDAVPVEVSQFRSLLAGRHPRTGLPLPLPAGADGRRRVAGYDLTFSAPKSASIAFALGGEEAARAVVTAHEEAVAGALRYMERHGLGATRWRRDEGEREVIATSGFTGAQFTHGVNRNLDPHLHSHVVVVNAVHGADGRWSACDGRGLDAHRVAAGGVYEAHLRHRLTAALGVRWDTQAGSGRTLEIAGLSPALLGEFSSRAADVRMHAFSTGARSAHGRHVAWAATRPPKVIGTPYDELAVEWRRRASVAGPAIELGSGSRVRGQLRDSALVEGSYDEHRFAGVIEVTPHRGAHRRDVVAAFAGSARDGVPETSLERVTDLWAPEARIGVAEDLMARRSVVPANHHLRALGPRPVDPVGHETWLTAARSIDAYRGRWGIERADEPLGGDRTLSSLAPARLADHLRVARQLDAARMRLGRRAPSTMELGLDR